MSSVYQSSITLQTPEEDFMNITRRIDECIRESGILNGICTMFCMHTTAGITVNENADPDVVTDLLYALARTYPDRPEFRHREGNSAAHLKSSVMGCSQSVPIKNGKLLLGRWQAVYFCEFDGPRVRTVQLTIVGN